MQNHSRLLRLVAAIVALTSFLFSACTSFPVMPPTAAPSGLAQVPSDVALARRFSAETALADIRTLAAAQFGGRKAGTPGADAAAQWLAGRFGAMGLQPMGDAGSYLQTLSLQFVDLAEMPALAVLDSTGAAVATFRPRQDFREVVSGYAGGGRSEGEVVYVGAGTSREYDGVDVVGKIALTISPQPVEAAALAAGHGARAVLGLTAEPWRLLYRGSYITPLQAGAIPCLLVGEPVVDALLKHLGTTAASLQARAPGPLGVRARASVLLRPLVDVRSSNVLAVLPGTDPSFAGEAVIVGAHYDHLGTDPDGTTYPGANDDASGVAAVLEIARVLTEADSRPKRTVLFAAWTAEEAGLLGAVHYVRNPRYPLAKTVAMLQLDVVGQGLGTALNVTRGRGSLPGSVHSAAADLGVPSGVEPTEGGSDHVPFVQSGVPAVLLIWSDVLPLIHTARDTAEGIDAAKLRSAGQVALLTVIRLASAR